MRRVLHFHVLLRKLHAGATSVLLVVGTGPGAGWMLNKYLLGGGRERGRGVREVPGLGFGREKRGETKWGGGAVGEGMPCAQRFCGGP